MAKYKFVLEVELVGIDENGQVRPRQSVDQEDAQLVADSLAESLHGGDGEFPEFLCGTMTACVPKSAQVVSVERMNRSKRTPNP